MTTVTSAQFRAQLSEYLERVRHEPIMITSRGARRRGVLVSVDFFDRAREALGDEPYAPAPLTPEQEAVEETMSIIRDL